MRYITAIFLSVLLTNTAFSLPPFPNDYEKKRVVILSDIGGSDPDDIQSFIHLLFYADMFDIEAVIASHPRGKAKRAKRIIRQYERDFPSLARHGNYPAPGELRKAIVQGSKGSFSNARDKNRGVDRILASAKKSDPRPLNILVWGSITDLAHAIKKDPSIRKKIRVYFIGSWNIKQDKNAWEYVKKNHNGLFPLIVSDSTFRGIYLTGMGKKGKYGNVGFVNRILRKSGAMGKKFHRVSKSIDVNRFGIKMGDTPSLLFLFNGDFSDPGKPSWGGAYCRKSKNYWIDCAKGKIGIFPGAKSIATHRRDILIDWEKRINRLN